MVTADGGHRGMLALRREHVDVVITDISMPEQEGLETITAIRRELPDIKIVAISGGGGVVDMDFLEVGRRLGADDVLQKPLEADQLLQMLGRLPPIVSKTAPPRAGLGGYDA